jgi:hypothetical protein
MPARLSGALPRASTCAAAAACSSAGPGPPAWAATAPRRQAAHATRHGRAPSLAMRRPRAGPGAGAANASPQQLRAVPAHTSRAPSRCRARLASYLARYGTATQGATQHPGNSRNNIRIISLTWGGAMGIRTPDLLHAMKPAPSPPPALTCRDQQKQRRGATQSDAEQHPQTAHLLPRPLPRTRPLSTPQLRPRRTLGSLAMQA